MSRRSQSAATPTAPSFPREFLTAESEIAEEFAAQPRLATRGESLAPGALDFSYDLDPGEDAILSIRHPSGALTFHLPAQSASRGLAQPNQVRFVVTVRSADVDTGRRGIASKVVKAILIKVGKVAADKVVSLLLPKLAAAFERHSWSKAGLQEGWLKVTKETLGNKGLMPGKPVSTDRSLLFIHGTFSNAASAYTALASSIFFDRVKSTYGDRIFAFDHFTVSRTPEENARMLLEGLPDQTTTFDVVTHSRGGLVLRSLVERGKTLGALAGRFKLGRAVLVASPNQGTPLATPQRWGDTVGWLANLLELFPDNPFTTGSAFVANGLVWLARHASGDLPGLHSMDGAGELISELQLPPGPPPAAYSALVANYNPTGAVLLRMLDCGIDEFFGSANDLVVPSEGGWRVSRPGSVLIPGTRIGCYGSGGNLAPNSVTHVSFFSRPETVDFLVHALSGEAQPLKSVEPLMALPDRRLLREGAATLVAAAPSPDFVEPKQPSGSLTARGSGADALKHTAPAPLKITVINGDLTFEKEPILLGHYRARKLTGTEKVMNDLIGGAMKVSLDLGVYPLAPGSHQIFVNTKARADDPKRMPRPKAVIVVGLGEEGKLQAADLSGTVRQAVIAWAQRTTELAKRPPSPFTLSATLIGSGGTGVSAGQAAQRIVQGVYEANALLSSKCGDDIKNWPRVNHLRLIELYLDRATEAWRTLKLQADATPDRYLVAEEVSVGTGPLSRPLDSGYRGTAYDFITVEEGKDADGQVSINYTLDTKRARSEVRGRRTQGPLLRDLVATASNAENQDYPIGRTLFKLLIPVELESYLVGSGEMLIELVPQTAGIPWELLDNDDGETPDHDRKPWSIRTKLLRKLRTKDFRDRVTDAGVEASVLVIGEPECPKNYPRLFGARQEAVAVHQRLTAPGGLAQEQVRALFSDDPAKVGPDALTVINALLDREWRIVHIAGHGQLVAEDGTQGGVVLKNGRFLGPNEIAGIRAVPELVFVNCCHLAARDINQLVGGESPPGYDRASFAAGVAEKLIEIGVHCVIAAGWAVDDVAARTFATTFYGSLLRGNRFIDAVGEARQAAYRNDDNTWAAYQCYGDPDWVFLPKSDGAHSSAATPGDEFGGVASEAALKLALETIVVQTTFQHFSANEQLEKVRSLEKRFAAKWGASGALAESFGKALAETKDLEGAIGWYERAMNAPDGTASMKAAEQLANVRVRRAWETVEKARNQRDITKSSVKTAPAGRSEANKKSRAAAKRALAVSERALRSALIAARQRVKDATTLLEKLVALQPTMERENLYGSAYKRLAMIEATAGRRVEERKAIEAMKQHYQRAEVIARESGSPDLFYPAMNSMAADLALNAGLSKWKGLDAATVEATRASLDAKTASDADFWSVAGQTELKLYEALAAGKLADARGSLEKGFQDLYKRVGGPLLWSSVHESTQFVMQKYAARASAKEQQAASTISASLAAFTETK